jgi:hypothetical protein
VGKWQPNGSEAFATFQRKVTAVRKVIESVGPDQLDGKAKAAFEELSGLPRFKCPKIQCLKFATGFPDAQARDFHVMQHDRPFKCGAEGCYARAAGFSSLSALNSHVARFHADDKSSPALFPPPKGKKKPDIFKASSQGNLGELKALHHQGVDLHTSSRPNGGLTPMVLASRHGRAHVCEYLVHHGADVVQFTYTGISPLGEAIKRRDVELVRFLCHVGRVEDRISTQHIKWALFADRCEILEEVLKRTSAWVLRQLIGGMLSRDIECI